MNAGIVTFLQLQYSTRDSKWHWITLNLIYIEYGGSETENIRTTAWETNGNLANSELLADRENSDNIMSFCFAKTYK